MLVRILPHAHICRVGCLQRVVQWDRGRLLVELLRSYLLLILDNEVFLEGLIKHLLLLLLLMGAVTLWDGLLQVLIL